jgi:hypothetical protein
MWGMEQISAAHRPEIELSPCIKTEKTTSTMRQKQQKKKKKKEKGLNLDRHSNKGRHRSIRGRHRGLPLQQKKTEKGQSNRKRTVTFLNNFFELNLLGAAAVKHLFHAAHNCHPWQDAPPAAHRPKDKKACY